MPNTKENSREIAGVSVLVWIVLLAFLIRVIAVVVRHENLWIDTDAYLAIAQNLLDGNGFCSTPGQPTAFRPPLYPLLVSVSLYCGGHAAIGVVQIVLGTATVWLTWRIARCCQFSQQTSLLAAAIIAVDPLLVEYSTQAMTETLSTFLVTLLLLATLRSDHGARKGIVVGVVFGLAALCRPSIWAFGGLAAVGWLVVALANRSSHSGSDCGGRLFRGKTVFACAAAVAVTVSPWVIRNTLQFGRPVLMTTHGGYTLLLGNNETFFREVVSGERGTVWEGSSLKAWQAEKERQLLGIGIARDNELSRDAAFSGLAKQWIVEYPYRFLRTCMFRIQRFWACWPSVSVGIPSAIVQIVGAYYLGTFALAVVGVFRWRRVWLNHWTLPALVLSLTLVHAVYWSNARMRSAIVPVVAVATAAALQRSRCQAEAGGAILQK
jgi:hypothetical protein